MNYFNPQPTSPDASTDNYTGHSRGPAHDLAEACSRTRFRRPASTRASGARATEDLTIAPGGNSGNYFAQQNRDASRVSWAPVMTFAAVNWLGTHNFKAGAGMAESSDNGEVIEHPINILDASNQLLERITFTRRPAVPGVGHRILRCSDRITGWCRPGWPWTWVSAPSRRR